MHGLFASTATTDPLGFWGSDGVDYSRVADFLKFDKNDLSKIGGVSKQSVRLDARIPGQLAERLEQIANVCSKVAEHFGGEAARTALWFKTANPMLGYVSPRDMIRLGRYDRLLRMVLEAESENVNGESAKVA